MSVSFRLGRGLAALVPLLLMSSSAFADPPPLPPSLTLARALALAHENNQVAAAARMRIGEAEGTLTAASVLLNQNPRLSVEAGPRTSGASGSSVDVGVGLQQRLEIAGQRSRRRAAARAQLAATQASAEDVQRVVDMAVAQSFYAALAAERRFALFEESEGLATQLRDIALRRVEAGEGVPLEVATARIRLAEAQRRRIMARVESETELVRLATLLGAGHARGLTLQGDLPESQAAPSAAQLVADAVARRPDLAAAGRRVDAAEANRRLANAEAWPDITVRVALSREGDENIIVAGLQVPLPFFQRNQGQRQRSRAALERRRAEAEALRLEVQSEVSRALLAYEQARHALELYDAEVLQAQAESLSLLQRSFESGEIGIADVIVMQRELLEGRQGYLTARRALALARAALLAAAHLPQTQALSGAQ